MNAQHNPQFQPNYPDKDIQLPTGSELFSVTDLSGKETGSQHVIVCGEERGGTDALLPVVRELITRNIGVTALMAGIGLRKFMDEGHQHGLHAQRTTTWPEASRNPDALLFSASNDGRLEEYLRSEFSDEDSFMLEDHYESSRFAIDLIHKSGHELPTICVIDSEAERLIRRRFPGLAVPVVETGSPAFDPLFSEDRLAVQARIKTELGIPDEKLITVVLPGLEHTMLAREVASALREVKGNYTYAIRRHPRDSASQATIDEIFAGIDSVDTHTPGYSTEDIGAASDLVIAQRSTYSLKAAARQIPNISMARFVPDGFTLPLVDSGASIPAEPSDLPKLIPEILARESLYTALMANMEPYRVDGKSALRVTDLVYRAIAARNSRMRLKPR